MTWTDWHVSLTYKDREDALPELAIDNITAGVIASLIATALLTTLAVVAKRFTVSAVNAQINLLHKGWIERFAVSVLFSMLFYLLFAYFFAAIYKWCGWVMGPGQIYGVIMAGTSSPLINFIAFMFLAPKKWGEAAVVGVASLFFTFSYMAIISKLYSFTFMVIEKLPGT